MKTCATCNWRITCDQRSSTRHACIDWEPACKAPPAIGIGPAIVLGLLMWAVLIYALPLLILAAKGFGQ